MTLPRPPQQAPAGINMTVHHPEGEIVEYAGHNKNAPTIQADSGVCRSDRSNPDRVKQEKSKCF